jgi:tetratricopeptide (TPR) repeat protein
MRWPSLGVLLFALWPAAAAAQKPADVERAKESFNAGATAYAAGEYLAAIQALDTAYALTPLPAIAFSLAQAERKQYFVLHERHHLDRAITLFRKYLDEVPTGGRRTDAVDALSQLEPLAALQASSSAAPPASETVRGTRLLITSDAPGALVSVDGGPPAPSPFIREVEPGPHRVEVKAEGFYSTERELTAVAGELMPTAVPLREQPSTMVVWTAADAELYVNGSFVRQGGDGVTLQLPSGTHRLDVAKKGHRISSDVLELERGQTQTLHVTLLPTSQRKASHVLFISGGAALGAGLLLGGLALRAENSARHFLERQGQENVSSADLSAYHEDVTDRGRYRTAAAIALASSVGLFLTGLLLHELDLPNLQELHRPPRPTTARATVMPLVMGGGAGAMLHASF